MRSHEEPTEFFFRLTWFTCVKLRYVTLTLRLRYAYVVYTISIECPFSNVIRLRIQI